MSERKKAGQRFVEQLESSGIEISKTGAAYRNPEHIIKSAKAQEQLKRIGEIRRRLGK